MSSQRCTIKGFWAKDNLELSRRFSIGHENVLRDHGFTHFKSNENSWHYSQTTYVLVALVDNEVVGGIRIEKRIEEGSLALEKAILKIDPHITDYLNGLEAETILESCGLWNAKNIAGFNISQFLTRLGTVLTPVIDKKAISFCFNATYTFRITQSLGYYVVEELGEKGYMNYPTPRFKAALWIHDDLINLGLATTFEKERILSLREDFNQEYKEPNKFGGIIVNYEINI